ncbi:MAG: hypothetical protein KUA43_19560 [Hoeflea sp.]|uniref:lysophospholipid acyltransferase family protein n=1 Tax=Hoeflea sp. TaxID=1940281 RepID=UPI001E0218BD|nr:hypothetical protein [Hoeflea sp.]MBU4527365.1 hypothetical protein [Alphaproteobacteria bacterium]MBU4546852.1 hypothetical protein [Alphaproteobacteria bacterium]MBU4551636.1 hypothetical protein [Alphaproteobacteria bacterium]MBV1725641.1 hypothetical protein [Hoeflea sp.]MBV1759689.1 hypothetical protein [Hoeflea sp.]
MIEFWRRMAVSLGVRVVAGTLIAILWIWSATLRKETKQLDTLDRYIAEGHQVLALFWHGKYVPLFPLASGRQAVVITIDSFRGRVIARISQWFGYRPVLLPAEVKTRGFPAMVEQVKNNARLIALALDGPSGPFYRIRSGALQLSSLHGVKLVPIGVASSHKILLTSRWDRQVVPLPFSRVAIAVGDMIDLSQLDTDDGTPQKEEIVRNGMIAAESNAEAILDGMKRR